MNYTAKKANGTLLINQISDAVPAIPQFRPRDPVSALTHLIGFFGAILGMPVLLIHAAQAGCGAASLISLGVFMLSMIFLYAASTSYHSFNLSARANKRLKKFDHMMIFVLIAGSYTPVCVMVLPYPSGVRLLALVWAIALAGMLLKAFWVTCPKWFSSVIYIGMGWVCLLAFGDICRNMTAIPFALLVAGGIFYTVGGVIYALKLEILRKHFRSFGAHELFHIFVMCGSLCHYLVMYSIV